ncbi:TadE/TadG family type IV pilus assembly protein [Pseudomonas sp. TE3610]
MNASLPRKQKGAAAIEFALVFVIFFAVFYGVVAYSLPLLMMQSFNQASAEGVRRAVSIDPTTSGSNYAALVRSTATTATANALTWIPPGLNFNSSYISVSYTGAGSSLTVTIRYPSSNISNVLPFLVLPGVGQVPSLPTTLTASASLIL